MTAARATVFFITQAATSNAVPDVGVSLLVVGAWTQRPAPRYIEKVEDTHENTTPRHENPPA
jgi:hypothetical protein